jgi:hypothetical protein
VSDVGIAFCRLLVLVPALLLRLGDTRLLRIGIPITLLVDILRSGAP